MAEPLSPAGISSSPDEAVTMALLSPDDYRQYQDLLRSIADILPIPPAEVQETPYKLLDIEHLS